MEGNAGYLLHAINVPPCQGLQISGIDACKGVALTLMALDWYRCLRVASKHASKYIWAWLVEHYLFLQSKGSWYGSLLAFSCSSRMIALADTMELYLPYTLACL